MLDDDVRCNTYWVVIITSTYNTKVVSKKLHQNQSRKIL
jgi:hypothetical protein